jgi:hypothetical protein
MVVSLIEEPDKPVNLVTGVLAELAYRAEDVLRRSVVFDVQPIQAGRRVSADVFVRGLCTLSARVMGFPSSAGHSNDN